MATGPGLPLRASAQAFRTTSGTRSGCCTCQTFLTSGCNTCTKLWSVTPWKGLVSCSCPRPTQREITPPKMATTGLEEAIAEARPITILAGPGPTARAANADLARYAGVAVGNVGRRLLMSGQHELDLWGVVNGVEDVRVTVPRMAEDVLYTLQFQCLHQRLSAAHPAHLHVPSPGQPGCVRFPVAVSFIGSPPRSCAMGSSRCTHEPSGTP